MLFFSSLLMFNKNVKLRESVAACSAVSQPGRLDMHICRGT